MPHSRHNRSLAPVVALLALAVIPAVAQATTVSHRPGARGPVIHVLDADGVSDKLEASGAAESSVRVRSTDGKAIAAGFACTQTTATQVDCPGGVALLADLGAGDDELLQRARIQSVLNGGEGNDRLTGGPLIDVMRGFAGNDILLGGEGNDDLIGDEGNDTLGRRAGSTNFGTADPGRDTFRGGEGFDRLFTADGSADAVIDCGSPSLVGIASFLELAAIDLTDPQPKGCECVGSAAKDQHPTVQVRNPKVRVRRGRALLRLSCRPATPGGRCAGTATIKKDRRTVARGEYEIRAGRSTTLSVRLTEVVRGGARVLTRERDTRGRPKSTEATIALRG